MRKKQPLSKADLLAEIERRLQDPKTGNREFASLTKRWANIAGVIKQGERPAQQPEPEPEDVREDREEREYQRQDKAYAADPEHVRWWAIRLIEQLAAGRITSPVLQRRWERMSPELKLEFQEEVAAYKKRGFELDAQRRAVEADKQERKKLLASLKPPTAKPILTAVLPAEPSRINPQQLERQLRDFYAIDRLP